MTVTAMTGGARPVVIAADHPSVEAGRRALMQVFGGDVALIRSGGSIPPVATFAGDLGLPCLLLGVGLPDDQIHAPNERFDLDQYAKGVRTIVHLWDEMAAALRR